MKSHMIKQTKYTVKIFNSLLAPKFVIGLLVLEELVNAFCRI
jgi:hypothetical protein